MPIDTSIYNRIQMPDVGNALQAYAQAKQFQASGTQNRLQQMQLQQAQRQMADNDLLRGAYEAGFDPASGKLDYGRVQAHLAQNNGGSLIPGVSKQASEDSAARMEAATKVLGLQKELSKGVLASPSLASAMASLDQMEALTGKGSMDAERQRLTQIGDNPEGIIRWAASHAMSAESLLPKVGSRDLGGAVQSTMVDPLTGKTTVVDTAEKVMAPGEIATANRAAEALEEQKRHNRESEATANKIASNPGVTYQTDANGNILALPTRGAPIARPVIGQNGELVQGSKGMTETQSNATAFGMRAVEAQKGLNALESQGFGNPGAGSKLMQSMPIAGNYVTPEKQQEYNQYKRNFISAVLRKESGAAISNTEFANEDAKYFPQPGDSQSVRQQKSAARDLAIKALQVQAGPGARDITAQNGSGQAQQSHGYASQQEAYQDYLRAFNAAKNAGNYDLARKITDEARKDGVVK